MSGLLLIGLLLFIHASSAYVQKVHLEQLTPFPVELDNPIQWRMSPVSGNSYDSSSGIKIYLNEKLIGSWNSECSPYIDDQIHMSPTCEVENGLNLKFSFTPTRDHFGKNIRITFYPNLQSTFSEKGQVLLNTTMQLIKQPKFLDMKLILDHVPDKVNLAPKDLHLVPPVFLDGSMAKVECTTDGVLPPQPITFDIVCNNPPRAAVEQDRQHKAQMGYPYEVSYSFFHFRSPPTNEELAEQLAKNNAKLILKGSRVASSPDNLTLSVFLPIYSKAHDCSIYCRIMGKEKQYRLTVYYPTTMAYILPPPTDGLMRVGSSMMCYADGFPEPSISLSLRQPMHQFSRQPLIDPREYMVTTSPVPPVEEQIVDTWDIAAATRIGLRPDEYTIRGPRFTLAYNATPGVELMLICIAGNALPNALDFLGKNKTIVTSRFTVAAISYSSIGIVMGICSVILLCAIVIILLMVYLRRRQKYTSEAIRTRNLAVNAADGANGAKMAGHGKQGAISASGEYATGVKTNRKLHEFRASLVNPNDEDMNQESPHRGLFGRSSTALNENKASIEYAELAFNTSTLPPGGGVPKKSTVGFATVDRTGSAPKLKRGPIPGPSSASMQQLPQSHTQESEEGEGNYTEIIGVLQPKAYTSQLVLKQQKEATQAILGMHSNSPSVFV